MKKSRTGRFLGIPYDWRKPSLQRTKERAWNVDEPQLLVPKSYGWGWSINFAALVRPFRRR
jgi:uncharacterized membrane protein